MNKTKVDYFVRISIDVIVSGNRNPISRSPRAYFGEVIFYFSYNMHLLALCKLFEVMLLFPYPYKVRTAETKNVVVPVSAIDCDVGGAVSQTGREFLFHKEVTDKDRAQILETLSQLNSNRN
jgi:hypothetical protein